MKKRIRLRDDFKIGVYRHFRIDGRTWIIGNSPLLKHRIRGMCLLPKKRGLPIAIIVSTHIKPNTPMFWRALYHESLHALFPKASEKRIREAADVLYRLIRPTA